MLPLQDHEAGQTGGRGRGQLERVAVQRLLWEGAVGKERTMKTLLTLAICLAAQQVAFSQQNSVQQSAAQATVVEYGSNRRIFTGSQWSRYYCEPSINGRGRIEVSDGRVIEMNQPNLTPPSDFDADFYLNEYPDIAAHPYFSQHPYEHYFYCGKTEHRQIHADPVPVTAQGTSTDPSPIATSDSHKEAPNSDGQKDADSRKLSGEREAGNWLMIACQVAGLGLLLYVLIKTLTYIAWRHDAKRACLKCIKTHPSATPDECVRAAASQGITIKRDFAARACLEEKRKRERKEAEEKRIKEQKEAEERQFREKEARKAAEIVAIKTAVLSQEGASKAAEDLLDRFLKLKIILDLGVSREPYREHLSNIIFEYSRKWSPYAQSNAVLTGYFSDIMLACRSALELWDEAVSIESSIDTSYATLIGGGFGVAGALEGIAIASVFNSFSESAARSRYEQQMTPVLRKKVQMHACWSVAAKKLAFIQRALLG